MELGPPPNEVRAALKWSHRTYFLLMFLLISPHPLICKRGELYHFNEHRKLLHISQHAGLVKPPSEMEKGCGACEPSVLIIGFCKKSLIKTEKNIFSQNYIKKYSHCESATYVFIINSTSCDFFYFIKSSSSIFLGGKPVSFFCHKVVCGPGPECPGSGKCSLISVRSGKDIKCT